jgi:arylsulfatase A-like enzyme
MVARLDTQVGRLLEAVRAEGLTENTLIVFLSDNGGPVDQNASLNAPLNGQKGILLEGGMRVPFVLSWPGKLARGQVYQPVVSSLDLAPTFLRLAGAADAAMTGLEGIDLWPRLTGADGTAAPRELKWRFTISAAMRDGDWKLIRLPDRLPLLFNLANDLSEQHDVALQFPERTKDMLARLGDWDVRLPHPVTLEGAIWKRRQLNLYDATFPLTQPVGGDAPRMISAKETSGGH